jgi:glycosyltransferase 2 family protein
MLFGELAGVSLVPWGIALGLHLVKLCVRARAWHNIVSATYPDDRVRFRHTLAAYLAGTGVGACVPAGAGQLVRLGVLRGRVENARFAGLLSTLVVESAFDAVLTALVVVGVVMAAGPGVLDGARFLGPVGQHPVIAAAVACVLAAGVYALAARSRLRMRSVLRDARRGLAIFGQPRACVCGVASWQALGYVLRVASTYWFLVAFHVPASLHTALLVIGVQLVAGAVPVTPGGAGSQQAILVVALSDTAAATVLSFGIGTQVTTMLADVVFGGVALLLVGGSLRWRRIAQAGRAWSAPDHAPAAPEMLPIPTVSPSE